MIFFSSENEKKKKKKGMFEREKDSVIKRGKGKKN